MDTIFAQATATGRAGVCIVRISGPGALVAGRALVGELPAARASGLRRVRAADGSHIDDALVLSFTAPDSFTGEDTVELHLHGSLAILRKVLAELGDLPGLRMAEPGEFTRRALENGKLDLTQVEGLADLIEAETEAQRVQALRVLDGALGLKVEGWRQALVRAAALLEATIDFADEEVPTDVTPEVHALLQRVMAELREEITGTRVAERVRQGFEVAILGRPNVGKSTLLNRIAGRDAAITSDIAGTTRDIVEVRTELRGLPVTFLDTAGLRESDDAIEKIGVERALARAGQADLRVFLIEPGDGLPLEPGPDDLVVRPKGDLGELDSPSVSGLTGAGVDALLDRIGEVLARRVSTVGLATHERHADAMRRAVDGLTEAARMVELGPDRYDIAAAELGFAIRALSALLGRIDVESLLDEIFSSFCVGK